MTRIRYADIAGYFASGPCAQLTGPPWRQTEPPHYEHAVDTIAWMRDHPEATCSPKIAAILAQLERDWRPR